MDFRVRRQWRALTARLPLWILRRAHEQLLKLIDAHLYFQEHVRTLEDVDEDWLEFGAGAPSTPLNRHSRFVSFCALFGSLACLHGASRSRAYRHLSSTRCSFSVASWESVPRCADESVIAAGDMMFQIYDPEAEARALNKPKKPKKPKKEGKVRLPQGSGACAAAAVACRMPLTPACVVFRIASLPVQVPSEELARGANCGRGIDTVMDLFVSRSALTINGWMARCACSRSPLAHAARRASWVLRCVHWPPTKGVRFGR